MTVPDGTAPVEFRILGRVEVLVGGQPRELNGRQRSLLAALLLNANRMISTERLAAALWHEPLPAKATVRVRTLVSELRRALGVDGVLLTRPPGYQARVEPGQLDLDVFNRLVEQARRQTDAHRAVAGFDEALALWRGTALDGASGPLLAIETTRLAELRLAAVEERVTGMLALGRHAELIPELSALVAEHATRERPHAQLMAALDGAGRRSEALAVFHRLRDRLVDELGLEPAAEIQRLHQQLLVGTSAPAPRAQGRPAPARWPSRQLPPPPARLVGREAELAMLDGLAAGPDRLGLVVGPAGVGKSTLVVHWAHRSADRFPDGQLYLDMRGFDRRAQLTPDDALPQLLRALGVPADEVPFGQGEQVALYRSISAGRSMLLVLDNVGDADQVRPLLPAGAACRTVLTSRDRLSGLVALDGARRLTLQVLSPAEAIEVLTQPDGGSGHAAGVDAAAVAELARLCGYLPLALRIAGAHLADQPHRAVAEQVDELARHGRLAGLRVAGDGRASVRGAFELSYQSLPPAAQRMFALLSLVPAPAGLSAAGAAALAGLPPAEVAPLLDRLARVHLVTPVEGGRFGCHDLLLDYAAELAAEHPAAARTAAAGRLLDFYLHATDNCAATIFGKIGQMLPRQPIPAGVPALRVADVAQARAWVAAEWDNVLAAFWHAATHGPDPLAWYLADALRPIMRMGASLPEIAAVGRAGLAAAQRVGDPLGEGAMHYLVGLQHWRSADFRASARACEQSLERYRAAGWLAGQAIASGAIGGALVYLGQTRAGLNRIHSSLEIYQRLGDGVSAATTLVNLSGGYLERGDFAESLRFAELAKAALAESGNRHAETILLGNMALAQHAQGRSAEALRNLEESLALCRAVGARHQETTVLSVLGTVHFDAGRYEQSMAVLDTARELANETGDARLQLYAANGLARGELQAGKVEDSINRLEQALAVTDRAGHQQGRIEALLTLSRAYLAQGSPQAGYEHAARALTVARKSGYLAASAAARSALAACCLALGDIEGCRTQADRALRFQRRAGHRLAEARTLAILAAAH